MEDTTSSHIDPNTLTASSAPDGTPTLSVKPSGSSTSTSTASAPPATGLRQRVNKITQQLDTATDHPAIKNAKNAAGKQVSNLREFLGRSGLVRDLEARTGVDRVLLVVGGVLGYLLLIPFNLFGLALPTTQFLTFVPPVVLAAAVLDRPTSSANDDSVKGLLSYFVVLGFIQFLESLAAGVLEKRIPQYYTLKLLFLAYLLHPKTQGAIKIHQSFLRRFVRPTPATAVTPPTAASGSSGSSPAMKPPTEVPLPGEGKEL